MLVLNSVNQSGSGDDVELSEISSPSSITKRGVTRTRTTSTSEKDGTIHMKGSKTIYTAGRPPWYDSTGQMKEALVIGM
jgi:uridine kinase